MLITKSYRKIIVIGREAVAIIIFIGLILVTLMLLQLIIKQQATVI